MLSKTQPQNPSAISSPLSLSQPPPLQPQQKNYPNNSVPVAIARVCMSLVVSVCVPLQFHPARICWMNLLRMLARVAKLEHHIDKNKHTQAALYWGVTAVMIVVIYTIAFFVSNLGVVFEVVGATASTSICYILPGLFLWRIFGAESALYRWGGIAFASLGFTIMCVSLAVIFVK